MKVKALPTLTLKLDRLISGSKVKERDNLLRPKKLLAEAEEQKQGWRKLSSSNDAPHPRQSFDTKGALILINFSRHSEKSAKTHPPPPPLFHAEKRAITRTTRLARIDFLIPWDALYLIGLYF
ncbi:hypothetical protein PoB_006737500 [Plakobranchus ocellatus]|uniref:Uncharacterized protein n=1 Tax=Plakobranchus ocellatus TaxID=259542 RepID=A0AAV4D9S7_9GAST|nr:hypothetical protein PoB_006737500 [Plakobranchus ocellatus]